MSKRTIGIEVTIISLFFFIIIGAMMVKYIPEVRKLKESNAALSKSYIEAKAAAKKTEDDCRIRIRDVDSKWARAYESLPERLHARANSTRFGRR